MCKKKGQNNRLGSRIFCFCNFLLHFSIFLLIFSDMAKNFLNKFSVFLRDGNFYAKWSQKFGKFWIFPKYSKKLKNFLKILQIWKIFFALLFSIKSTRDKSWAQMQRNHFVISLPAFVTASGDNFVINARVDQFQRAALRRIFWTDQQIRVVLFAFLNVQTFSAVSETILVPNKIAFVSLKMNCS